MPILLAEREQCELRAGGNALGGGGPDAVALTELAGCPLVGTIILDGDAPPAVQRLSPRVALMVDGTMLGAAPRSLTDGATIQVGSVRMTYFTHAESAEAAAPGVPRRRRQSELATQVMTAIVPPARPAALIALDSGRVIRLPHRDVVLGRSEDADVALTGQGISRRHAILRPDGGGYDLVDQSTNGTFVNGQRLDGPTPLAAGDIIAVGDDQFRFDYVDVDLAARLPRAADSSPGRPLAELEIVRGTVKRRLHRIDRPVCAIGRGAHNDVDLDDESVSSSHATLLLKADTWYLTDLRSGTGTYADGYRVAGERALAAGSMIRVGAVTLAFRPTGVPTHESGGRGRGGMLRRFARALLS